jgi:hypothetical protein
VFLSLPIFGLDGADDIEYKEFMTKDGKISSGGTFIGEHLP